MVTVIKAVTLFPTPSAGAKHTPNLAMFHEYLDKDSTKDEKSMKEMVSSIAKTLHSAGEGKATPRRLTRLISHCLLQKHSNKKHPFFLAWFLLFYASNRHRHFGPNKASLYFDVAGLLLQTIVQTK